VYLIRPGHTGWIIAASWLAVCIVVGGVLAVLVAAEIAAYAHALEAGDPPAGRARWTSASSVEPCGPSGARRNGRAD
jgi:hypothetical protein